MSKLSGKTILITGASSGIGKAMALRSAKDGATVVIAARSVDKLNEVAEGIKSLGGQPIVVETDVTKVDDIRNLFLKATENGRVLDVVFDNAGLGFVSYLQDLTAEQIQKMIDVNVTGMIMVAKFAVEVMVRQKYGHLIMTSSLAGLLSLPQWSVYVATKWAITGFSDSIRPELKQHNVKVTTLHPGSVRTNFFDKDKANIDVDKLGGEGDTISPEEVAEAVYEAIFTNTKKIKVPTMAKTFSLIYKYLPGVVEAQLERMTKDLEYRKEKPEEDEPEFSYIKNSD